MREQTEQYNTHGLCRENNRKVLDSLPPRQQSACELRPVLPIDGCRSTTVPIWAPVPEIAAHCPRLRARGPWLAPHAATERLATYVQAHVRGTSCEWVLLSHTWDVGSFCRGTHHRTQVAVHDGEWAHLLKK